MESRAKLFGHAVHPMLIPFPVGLFVTAVVFDVVHLLTGRATPAIVSYWMIAAGIVGGLAAALFGYIDYRGIPEDTRARRVGRIHGVGNLVVVLVFVVSWWLRRGSPAEPPAAALALSFVGVALASVTAWLGGELVERLGVGVDDGANLDAPSSLSAPTTGDRASTTR
jgi:uncharacterized membrane protein